MVRRITNEILRVVNGEMYEEKRLILGWVFEYVSKWSLRLKLQRKSRLIHSLKSLQRTWILFFLKQNIYLLRNAILYNYQNRYCEKCLVFKKVQHNTLYIIHDCFLHSQTLFPNCQEKICVNQRSITTYPDHMERLSGEFIMMESWRGRVSASGVDITGWHVLHIDVSW